MKKKRAGPLIFSTKNSNFARFKTINKKIMMMGMRIMRMKMKIMMNKIMKKWSKCLMKIIE